MISRKMILFVLLLALLLPSAGALAGGWVVITLETLPEQIRAGEPQQLSFMVRQHGQTPIHDVEPLLTATNAETGERIQVQAEPAEELGRFLVTVDFPSQGVWEWSISAQPFPQTVTFAPITVQAGQESGAVQSSGQSGPALQVGLRWAGLALLAAAALLLVFSRWGADELAAPISGD